jgi:signal transduction histidine kinase
LYNICDKLVNKVIANNVKNSTFSQEIIEYSHLYFLNEIAFIESLSSIYNCENIILPYHNKDIIEIADFIKSENIGVCFLNIKLKKNFINQITDNINIFIIDKKMRYRYISENMIKTICKINYISLSKNQILGKTFFQIFGSYNKRLIEIDKNVIDDEILYEKEEVVQVNNETRYFKVIKKPLYSEKKEIIGLIGTSMDITEIKEAQIKAEKEKEERLFFTKELSHEISNKIQILQSIKLLKHDSISTENKKEIIECFEEALGWIENYVMSVKNADLEKNTIDLIKENNDLVNLIQKNINTINLSAKNDSYKIFFSSNVEKCVVFCDSQRILQVILNLIQNSIRCANTANKIIDINLTKSDEKVFFSVKDNGNGLLNKEIDVEDLFKSKDQKRYKGIGLGIGLPICKTIVEGHEGKIELVDSSNGLLVNFWLPIC